MAALIGWETPYTVELLLVVGTMTVLGTAALGVSLIGGQDRPVGRTARWVGYAGPSLAPILIVSIWILIFGFLASGPELCGIGGADSWYGSWPFPNCLPGGALPAWLRPTGKTLPTGIPIVDAFVNGDYVMALDALRRLMLPSLVLAAATGAIVARRWEARREDRIENRAVSHLRWGLGLGSYGAAPSPRLRAALSPTAKEVSLSFGLVVGAIPVVEFVFGLHGLGRLFVDALTRPFDWAVLVSSFFVLCLLSIGGSLAFDALRAYVDPRSMVESRTGTT